MTKNTYFRKIPSSHFFTEFVLSHASSNTTSPNIGGTDAWAVPSPHILGERSSKSPMSPPMVRPAVQLLAGVEDHRNNFYLKQRKFQKWVCHLNSNHQCIGYSGFWLRIHSYVRQVGAVQHSSFTLYSTASSKPRGIPLTFRSPGDSPVSSKPRGIPMSLKPIGLL